MTLRLDEGNTTITTLVSTQKIKYDDYEEGVKCNPYECTSSESRQHQQGEARCAQRTATKNDAPSKSEKAELSSKARRESYKVHDQEKHARYRYGKVRLTDALKRKKSGFEVNYGEVSMCWGRRSMR